MPLDFTADSTARFLTEGGTETEIMYRHGFDFPHFAVFELLRNPQAVRVLKDMFTRYLDVVAESGFSALIGGLDYRASPDWGKLPGCSPAGLLEVQTRCIEFLRDVARPYEGQIPEIRYAGIVGPRGDAYALNRTITAEEAEAYHAVQLESLMALGVDCAWAATFNNNNVPEAVGLCRAAARIGVPVMMSLTLSSGHRPRSGPTLRETVEAIDAASGAARPSCFGINCSHPLEFAPALEPGEWLRRVRSIRPNAAMMDKLALCKLNHLEEGNPAELGRQLGELSRAQPHIDMWGGCCGTWDRHLREIARNAGPVPA